VSIATAVLVAGLGFGDEGKGTTVDYLCAERSSKMVVRYNGGAQAAHNVVTPSGQHHTFAQVGSGLFQGAHTYLSKFFLLDPLALLMEMKAFDSHGIMAKDFVHVDVQCPITTGYHRATNRIWERVRGDGGRHGSCGVGIGETRRDQLDGLELRVADLSKGPRCVEILEAIREKKLKELPPDWQRFAAPEDLELMNHTPQEWAAAYGDLLYRIHRVDESYLYNALQSGTVIFEGAQGVLLDEDYGFFPYNSWTKTTFANADELLKEVGFNGLVERVGVLRTYMTRHGAGPFPSEGMLSVVPDGKKKVEHNETGPWQGSFRTGHLDLVALRYAVEVIGGVDYLSLTHMDCQPKKVCWGYSGVDERFFSNEARLKPEKRKLDELSRLSHHLFEVKPQLTDFSVEVIERNLGAHVRLESYGPTCRDKRKRA